MTHKFQSKFITLLQISDNKYENKYLDGSQESHVVCEESGPVNLTYNTLLTTLKTSIVVKHVIPIVIVEPRVQPIIVNDMVELAINQPIAKEEVNIDSYSQHFEHKMQF